MLKEGSALCMVSSGETFVWDYVLAISHLVYVYCTDNASCM